MNSDTTTGDHFHQALEPGEWLFREGASGDCAWTIEAGVVEVILESGSAAVVLARLKPGDLLGEMALIDGRPRTASARALTSVRLRRITREQITDRLHRADPMLRLLLQGILRRYRDTLDGAPAPRLESFEDDRAQAMARIALEQDLALALARSEFQLHFQPILRLSDRRCAGFEALIRWHSPTRGLVTPAAFIPAAEESGLIVAIGHWVFTEACAALGRLDPEGACFMTLNLSGRQLGEPDLVAQIVRAASAAGLPPRRIKLEITESLLMRDFEHARRVLQSLRDEGFRVAVDDFGTGYSSLSYLHRLPADTLKIDRAFVSRLPDDAASAKIIRAIAHLAVDLGMDVVGEGIETATQARLLGELGLEYGQGFLFSPAVPEAAAQDLVGCQWTRQ